MFVSEERAIEVAILIDSYHDLVDRTCIGREPTDEECEELDRLSDAISHITLDELIASSFVGASPED